MAIQKQVVPISLGSGIDTKTDPKQVVVGKLLKLFNATFQKGKKLIKCFGTTALSQGVIGGASTTTGIGIAAYSDELVMIDGKRLLSYSPSETAWANRGFVQPVQIKTENVIRSTNTQTVQDSAFHAATNLTCFTWVDSSYGLSYSVYDNSTNMTLLTVNGLNGFAQNVKVLTLGTNFIIMYYDTAVTQLRYYAIPTGNPTTVAGPTSITTDINSATPNYDAQVFNNRIYFFYARATSVAGYYLTSALALSTQVAFSGTLTGANVLSVIPDASNNVWVTGTQAAKLVTIVYDSTLSQILAQTTVDTKLAAAITGWVTGTTMTYYYQVSPTPADQAVEIIYTNTLTLAGVVGTPTEFIRGVGLTSKAFNFQNVNYMLVSYNGSMMPTATNSALYAYQSIEPTYFLLNNFAQVVARIAGQSAGPFASLASTVLTEAVLMSGTTYEFAYLIRDNISTDNNTIFYKTGVSSLQINFTQTSSPPMFQIADDLHVGGGMVSLYDGGTTTEHGFHVYPENLTGGTTFANTGAVGPGSSSSQTLTYQYCCLYEWVDNQGQIHRSAPSVPLTVSIGTPPTPLSFTATATQGSTVLTSVSSFSTIFLGQVLANAAIPVGSYIVSTSPGASTITISQAATATSAGTSITTKDTLAIRIICPTLKITNKNNVSLAFYRTTNNGTIFYRTSLIGSLFYNVKNQNTLTYIDGTGDTILVGNEPLYTNGGAVENIPAPPTQLSTLYKNRSIVIPSENPLTWWYSKQVVPGSPLEYSSFFVNNIDSRGGGITAVGVLDEKLIFFKNTSIFYVQGSGPADNGSNNDFSEAQMISSDCGCSNQQSLAITSDGLMFQADKGLYLLDRSFNVQFIGAEAEDYTVPDIKATSVTPAYNQARFCLGSSTSQIAVYDYNFRQWSIFSGIDAFSTTVVNELVHYLTPTGKVLRENPALFTNDTAFIPMNLTTGWLNFAGIQGFQRVRRLEIIGDYKSPHTLVVTIFTDFSTTPSQTVTIPVLTDPGLYQYRIPLTIQKCETIQIQVQDTQTSAFGEGMQLSAMTLEVGIKTGANKISSGKTYG